MKKSRKKPEPSRFKEYVRKNCHTFKKRNLRKSEIKYLTEEHMKSLNTYNPAFDDMIHIYAEMLFELETCRMLFEEQGRVYETETAAGGTKKSPLLSTIENLTRNIGIYSDRLQLNPKALGAVTFEEEDKMSKFLSQMGADNG